MERIELIYERYNKKILLEYNNRKYREICVVVVIFKLFVCGVCFFDMWRVI